MNQKQLDRRKTYRLTPQADLTPDGFIAWTEAISGTLRGSRWAFMAVPSVVLETFATAEGIQHRLKVPYGHADYVIKQLRMRGVGVEDEKEFEDRNWTKGIELRMTRRGRSLRITDIADTAHSILVNFEALDPDAAVMLQIVFTPAGVVELPVQGEAKSEEKGLSLLTPLLPQSTANKDEVKDRRDKLTETNVLAAVRIVAHARTESAAELLMAHVEHAFNARRSPGTRFKRRKFVDMNDLRDRVKRAATPTHFPLQLSASELAALSAWSFGAGAFISGLAPSTTRHMPAPATVPIEGRRIGTATFQGNQRPVAMPYKHAVRHTWTLGPSGVGKTTLLANMALQDIENNYGIVVIETKDTGDLLFDEIITRIPDNRVEDVIAIDVNDREMPVAFNLLDQGSSRIMIDQISYVIGELYADTGRSLLSPQMLYHMLHALAEVPGHTFNDLPVLMANHPHGSAEADWQDWLIRKVKSKDIRDYMQRHMNKSLKERDDLAKPVYNRTWEFTSRPEIKYIFGQRKSSFNMADAMRANKIVLIKTSGDGVGKQSALIAGTLFANAVYGAAKRAKAERPNFLYLDEFQDVARFPIGLDSMMVQARSANLGLTLANQHTGQLRGAGISSSLLDTVMANTATKIVFQTTEDDARVMARNFQVRNSDFMNLASYQVIAKIATATGTSMPVTVATTPPRPITGNEEKVRQFSRMTYGRPLEDVERDIETRPIDKTGKRPLPPVSGEGWR